MLFLTTYLRGSALKPLRAKQTLTPQKMPMQCSGEPWVAKASEAPRSESLR